LLNAAAEETTPSMRVRIIAFIIPSLILAAATLGCAPTCPQGAATPPAPAAGVTASTASAAHASKPPDQRRVYRFDFVLTTTEVSKPPASSSYALNLEEDQHGELRLGSNVPLSTSATGAVPRQDVGLSFRCSFVPVGEDLLLHDSVEMSSLEEGSAIRKLVASGDTVVSPGKPALVSSLEDPVSHKRFQVMVSATKLR
jgi:hypothetical protein